MNNPVVIFNQTVNPGAPLLTPGATPAAEQTGEATRAYFGNVVTTLAMNAAYLMVGTRGTSRTRICLEAA
jgi:hypothetical protein